MELTKWEKVKELLEKKVELYNQAKFIENDPICIPHSFKKRQDIEIMGFWTAILTWGQRITTIRKSRELASLMDNAPYEFIMNHQERDLKRFEGFKHRTFNLTDTLYFIAFFKQHYSCFDTLEDAFMITDSLASNINSSLASNPITKLETNKKSKIPANFQAEIHLNQFRRYFFSLEDFPRRTQKHITAPEVKSTVKRINMFLRWMVREDKNGVDFGLWKRIDSKDLMIPLDVHVERVARKLGLLERKQRDWKAVKELTDHLRIMDRKDPIKYDFALFNLGIEENF